MLSVEWQPQIQELTIRSTDPQEVELLTKAIIENGNQYFAYVNTDGDHKLEIYNSALSPKGHEARIHLAPLSSKIRNDNIYNDDFEYFAINTAIANGWLPFPGNGSGKRFIKYNE